VRARLLLLVIIPTISAIALGGISVSSSVRSAYADQRVETLATVSQWVVPLAQALENERDQTVFYISLAAGGRADALAGHAATAAAALSVVNRAFSTTDRFAAPLRSLAAQIGSAYSPQTRQAASTALTAMSGLQQLRDVSVGTKLPALVVVQEYTHLINEVLALDAQIAQLASDPALAQTVRVLGLVSAMQEQASQQRAILAAALLQRGFGPGALPLLQAAQSGQQSNLAAFDLSASAGQQRLWNTSVDKSFVYLADSEELQAISLQNATGSLASDPTTPADWFGAMSNTVDVQMSSVTRQLAAAIAGRASVLYDGAVRSAITVGLLLVVVAVVLTVFLGPSVARRLLRSRHYGRRNPARLLRLAGPGRRSQPIRDIESLGEEPGDGGRPADGTVSR
jgi:hypothetical protein